MKNKVLIIDDDPGLRATVVASLRLNHFEPFETADGPAGLDLARTARPDLVLCDLHLEGCDGFEVLTTFRREANNALIPFIFMTGSQDPLALRRGMDCGADDFLYKPFSTSELLTTIQSRLAKAELVKREVEQTNTRLRTLLEATGDVVAILDPRSLELSYLNRAGRLCTGSQAGREAPSITLAELYPPPALAQLRSEAVPAAIAHGVWSGETVAWNLGGAEISVWQQVLAHRTEDGVVDYIAVVARDLTPLKQREERLRQERSLLRTLIDTLPDMIYAKDLAGRKTLSNRTDLANLGFTEESQILGKTDAEVYPATVASHFQADDETVLQTGQAIFNREERVVNAAGEQRWLSTSKVPLRDEAGRVTGLIGIGHDITHRKRAEAERNRMELELRHAQKMECIGRLAAGVAHEINTPIQYIGDNARFLQNAFAELRPLLRRERRSVEAPEDQADSTRAIPESSGTPPADVNYLVEEIPKALEQTLEGVERVAKIVGAMKDFSHPGVQEKAPTDLNRAIESTLAISRNEWKYVANLVTEFDPALPAVPCLAGEFNQAFLNLVVNAAHAIADKVGEGNPAKGTIHVTTRQLGDWAEIRVRDTGTGIPEAVRPRIFEPFFTTKGVGRGTGQGLAIAHSVIRDKHGGTIQFESESGAGTTFMIRLPIRTPPAQDQQAEGSTPTAARDRFPAARAEGALAAPPAAHDDTTTAAASVNPGPC